MSVNSKDYALVFGASVVDIFGFSGDCYRQFNSTPGRVKISFGGVCRNIAENMARIGVNTKLISILGNDEIGRSMLDHSKVIGYDMSESLILQKGGTPTYMAILNENGEMVSGIADMKSIGEMDRKFILSKSELIENAEYTFLDADDPNNLEFILTEFQGKTKFILDPVSAAKAEKIKHLIKYFHTIKPNRHEAEVLAGFKIIDVEDLERACDYFLEMGIENVFISLDEDGIFFSNSEKRGQIKAKNVLVRNVTGAGDSFVAGLGYSYMNDLSIEEAVKFSMGMSIITIAHVETIHPKMSYDFVMDKLKEISWEETVRVV